MLIRILFFIFWSTVFYGQERTELYGSITGSGNLENIHVLNKNANKGTISNASGHFKIFARASDTLIVSGIQFYYQEISITATDIKNNTVFINLLQRINELDEVTVKSNKLSGNLRTDLNNAKIDPSKKNSMALDFSGIDFSLPHMGPKDANDRAKPPDPFGGNHGVPGLSQGGDILGLAGLLLSPLIKSIGKIGETKRKNKRYDRIREKQLTTVPDQLIDKYLSVIVHDLHIPSNQIFPFIQHCKSKGIYTLFIEDRQMEVLNILIKESKIFLKSLDNKKE
ncbi:carboxypeptidase-like regulatory domain-containing protein [Flavobacteriaceae bacterium F08102]|nr:carboxypeptidase-like regulatory domain-containing protein [Flavobacteriaceae bacterium F08102]